MCLLLLAPSVFLLLLRTVNFIPILMINKILQYVNEHSKKFSYTLSEREKDEMITLYEMNHEIYDESSLSLHIELFVQRISGCDRTDWEAQRRHSVVAKRVDPGVFELPLFTKSEKEFEFLGSMLGSEIPFSFLSQSQKNRLIASMYPMIVEANIVLIHQGEIGSEMYIIEEGEFDVLIDGVFVNKLLANTKFGELALLHEIPRTATVRAVTSSKVWAAEQTSFSCIRIRDHMYKKSLVKEALEGYEGLACVNGNSMAISQAVSISNFKIFMDKSTVLLHPDEILIVFKDAKIIVNGGIVDVAKKEIVRTSFVTHTVLECGIINLKNVRR